MTDVQWNRRGCVVVDRQAEERTAQAFEGFTKSPAKPERRKEDLAVPIPPVKVDAQDFKDILVRIHASYELCTVAYRKMTAISVL
jgi:hypothetical protein